MVKPLEYHAGLSLEEAEERLQEVISEFERVKTHYSGIISRFKRNMSTEDRRTLNECIGVLFPLSAQDSVQAQVREAIQTGTREDTLHYQISEFSLEIYNYLARFKNTGVTMFKNLF